MKPLEDVKPIEDIVITALKNHPEKCIAFDEIIENFSNPKKVATIAHALNNLVERGLLEQFRAIHYGRIQNHYRLVE